MQQHRELELMNSFREQFGCDWLQYRNHLETSGTSVLAPSKTPAVSAPSPDTLSPETVRIPPTGPLPPEKKSAQEIAEVRVGPEPQEEEEMEGEGKEEEEEGEQEQNEVEGECSVAVCLGQSGKPRCGVADPFVVGGPPHGMAESWHLSFLIGSLSWSLFSGALSPHIGVSPGGAAGRAGQAALSAGHFWPPL